MGSRIAWYIILCSFRKGPILASRLETKRGILLVTVRHSLLAQGMSRDQQWLPCSNLYISYVCNHWPQTSENTLRVVPSFAWRGSMWVYGKFNPTSPLLFWRVYIVHSLKQNQVYFPWSPGMLLSFSGIHLGRLPKAFQGQPRNIVPLACPGSSSGHPSRGMYPEPLPQEVSRRHHNKMANQTPPTELFTLTLREIPDTHRKFISAGCIHDLVLSVTIQRLWP